MEQNCRRCQETIRNEDRYCPACGMPQLVYTPGDETGAVVASAGGAVGPEQAGELDGIAWRPALKGCLMLALPVGLLSPMLGPLSVLAMAGCSAWAVRMYVRSARPAWLTAGTGARIGLVTGLFASWLVFAVVGAMLFAERYLLHQGDAIDQFWQELAKRTSDQMATMPLSDPQAALASKQWLAGVFSPAGEACFTLGMMVFAVAVLLLFAVAGGAVGARLSAQTRRMG